MDKFYPICTVAVIALVTALLRFLPFWIFRDSRSTPPIIRNLGQTLPHAIMGMLVIYCLKAVNLTVAPFGIPDLIGCCAVVLLHLWKRNTLLSIGGGTVLYMLLVQLVF